MRAPGSISFAIFFVAFADTTTRIVDTFVWVVGNVIDLDALNNYSLAPLTVIAPCTAATTNDNNACTLDACDPLTGIVTHTPVATDDGNACTDDSCDATAGVSHVNNTAPCNDATVCNGAEVCGGGTCNAGTAYPLHEPHMAMLIGNSLSNFFMQFQSVDEQS